MIPMVNLRLLLDATEREWRANLNRMFERMQFIQGEQVSRFEEELAQAFGAGFAVAVGTGTAAIELGLRTAGVTCRSQEVITSGLTSPFTALAILAAGGTPRFADVDPDTLLIDAGDAEARVTRRTAALVPVHLYGQPCNAARWAAMGRKNGLALIQDGCQAHGANWSGRPFTAFGASVAYSFYPTKNLACLGDGGAVLTNSAATARQLRLLRDGGRKGDQVSWIVAINSRLDEMQACYLRAFLPHLEEWNRERARLAELYDEALRDCAGARPIKRVEGSVNHLYVIRSERRARLRDHLSKHGVMTGVHYPVALHRQPAFRDFAPKRGGLPNAERACSEVLSLPLWPYMGEAGVRELAERVRVFYGAAR